MAKLRMVPTNDNFTRPKSKQEILDQQHDEWTTKDCAEYFHVTSATILNWIHAGKLKAEEVTLEGKTGRVGKYIVRNSELERIDRIGRELIKNARKYYVRIVWRHEQGLPL